MAPPPSKVRRVAQKFREEYSKTWSFITASKKGDEFAYCAYCDTDIKIATGARSDLERHIKTPKHVGRSNSVSLTPSITSMFASNRGDPLNEKVKRAEAMFVNFLVEHNLPLATADHAGELFRKMFPDSEVAKQFKCGRTKARQLVKDIANDTKDKVKKNLAKKPFSLSTDGSNDKGSEQLYPVVVRYFDELNGKIVTDVLSVVTPEGASTGENIFNALDKELKTCELSWDNCVSFGCDNANVMLGKEKGVIAFVRERNSNIHVQGCPCHLLHIAAKKGASNLRCKVEEVLIDIFHYLENSTKRMKALQEFQTSTGTALRKILKHGPTRWLSLLSCVQRLLQQWDALSAFFESDLQSLGSKATERLKRICIFFSCKASKAYILFLQFSLPMFVNANLLLQREEPTIHLLQRRLHSVATDLLIAFVKPEVITKAENIYGIEHHRRSKQKDREELMIGEGTRAYLDSKLMSDKEITKFFEDARAFYSSSLAYIFSNLPMQEEALDHVEILDPSLRVKKRVASLRYWASRFPCLVLDGDKERLEKEFGRYQVDCLEGMDLSDRVDVFWSELAKKEVAGERKYEALGHFMKGLCVLPHSNADSERVFSLVRKNKTEQRASMSRDLLSEILQLKTSMISRGMYCYSFSPPDHMVKRA